jgi:hypothetical protein
MAQYDHLEGHGFSRLGLLATALCFVVLGLVLAATPVAAQIHGIPPSVTSIPNHVPPFMPNAMPSVTSLGPYGYAGSRPSNIPYRNPAYPNYGRHYRGYGGNGYGVAVPYYYLYPAYDQGYDTSGGSGQYLYSGPPPSQAPPAEQTLHIIVDTAPVRSAAPKDEVAEEQPARPIAQPPAQELKPPVPTILVFRDGHEQEITNYAIMGQTLYVFDNRTKKIALAELDVPATIKANDDQGVEFQIPKAKQNSKPAKTSGTPLQSVPEETPAAKTSVASVLP